MNHYSRKFSIQNLRAPLNERRCLKAEGVLWFCPHKIWSYGEVISQAKNRNELYPYNQRESDIYGLCACEEHFYNNFFGMGFRAFPIDVFSSRTQITWTALYERLHGVHPRICPHLTVSDSAVLVKFSDQCTQTFDATGTDLPHCGNCWTKVWFKRLHNANGTITLYLVIGQKINAEELSGANCENWKKYLSLPSELKGPQKEWDEHQICCIKDSELKKQVLSPSNNPFLAWEAVDWRD
ncbi:MAG: hypothetical protein L6R41_004449 [Letrouitia leprolyta]|nr:MAG: hypothetical protein L6R41_004449 [Letrouitia leprolyta]